jgi:hypothetical protein
MNDPRGVNGKIIYNPTELKFLLEDL